MFVDDSDELNPKAKLILSELPGQCCLDQLICISDLISLLAILFRDVRVCERSKAFLISVVDIHQIRVVG